MKQEQKFKPKFLCFLIVLYKLVYFVKANEKVMLTFGSILSK